MSDHSIFTGHLRHTLPPWLAQHAYSKIFLLADTRTRALCLPVFFEKTQLGDRVTVHEIPPGEAAKTIETCQQIWQALLDCRLDRQGLVVNLGGGVPGDMGGFCAATYKRGVDFIQVPTTLLAMTDAAIGGKLGIDFQGVKNAVGVFRQPAAVFVDPVFLKTLPAREWRSGLAEMIKHAWVGDPGLWAQIRTLPAGARPESVPPETLEPMLRASIAVKVRVVTEDPFEKGLRALLNFGHSIGHALESYFLQTPDPLAHGEAVAIGMLCETYASGENAARLEDLIAVVLRHFAHRPVPEQAFDALWAYLLHDKKNTSGTVRMAVPEAEPFSLRLAALSRSDAERAWKFYNDLG